ncbi:hypothetical protein FGO68_gene17214 [Halteria grandinella]|uniref:Uncharacterized protein n=1 Tax=Halteria grandinella TaxID=5974 RepID=A0A8J8P429_HALGN|nr:hypothetical protein FGO68_gene17214 [Halteria grandinella]
MQNSSRIGFCLVKAGEELQQQLQSTQIQFKKREPSHFDNIRGLTLDLQHAQLNLRGTHEDNIQLARSAIFKAWQMVLKFLGQNNPKYKIASKSRKSQQIIFSKRTCMAPLYSILRYKLPLNLASETINRGMAYILLIYEKCASEMRQNPLGYSQPNARKRDRCTRW